MTDLAKDGLGIRQRAPLPQRGVISPLSHEGARRKHARRTGVHAGRSLVALSNKSAYNLIPLIQIITTYFGMMSVVEVNASGLGVLGAVVGELHGGLGPLRLRVAAHVVRVLAVLGLDVVGADDADGGDGHEEGGDWQHGADETTFGVDAQEASEDGCGAGVGHGEKYSRKSQAAYAEAKARVRDSSEGVPKTEHRHAPTICETTKARNILKERRLSTKEMRLERQNINLNHPEVACGANIT